MARKVLFKGRWHIVNDDETIGAETTAPIDDDILMRWKGTGDPPTPDEKAREEEWESQATARNPASRYESLETVSGVYKFIAVGFAVVTFIGAGKLLQDSPVSAASALLGGLVISTCIWAGGALISVFLAIEANTRRTADLLASQSNAKVPEVDPV
jgi:hypothetical protein